MINFCRKNNAVKVLLTILISLSASFYVHSQVKPEKDSIKKEKPGFLDQYKGKSKLGNFIHRLIVKRPSTKKGVKTTDRFGESIISFKEFQGKTIRNIEIETFDPFGYSITDSTAKPENFLERTGNTLHAKTKKFVIRNYLLQDSGDSLDSLKILESERLIRSQRFSRRVKISVKDVGNGQVDLIVKSLDSWSIAPYLLYSGSKVGGRLRDRNFFGLGHIYDIRYRQNFDSGNNLFQTGYTIPNIQKSFIGFNVNYYSNEQNDITKGILFQRNFFSPLTRWAGGVYVGQRSYLDSIPNDKGIFAQKFKYNLQDYWGGFSFRLFKDENSAAERLNNLIVSARYFNVNYVQSPIQEIDPVDFYSDEEFYLLGVGISRRGFVQDRYIMNYDIVEDIPVGMSYGVTTGFQNKNNRKRFYLAGSIKMGNYYRLGYFGFNALYGGFLVKDKTEQSVFSLSTNYYTRLMSWGNWKFRNFINTELIFGNNRVNSRGDRLTLNENDPGGISGFYSRELTGTNKWVTDIQIQSYSPYQILGFRFSPFLNSSLGLISNEGERLFEGKVYAKIGVGILFTNDYLVFSNFQLSIAWFNSIPGSGNNIFKTNAFDNDDYELMDFDFGKPRLIPYNPYMVN